MAPRVAAHPPPRALPQIEEGEEDDDIDEEAVACLDTIHGALRSTDIVILRKALTTAQEMVVALQEQRDTAREEAAEFECQLISIHAYQRKARKTTKENRARAELDDEISSMIPEDAKKIARALNNGQRTVSRRAALDAI
ncbi:hypothetical protein BKA70DRAFT_1451042 [Coprinopsis sp. MPI-PUGE-AT-0042]|nr:hypothetical protein BKA70DRAFT_1451042 [Coprinopsis sp. MPI-PUGE-AT-0042]